MWYKAEIVIGHDFPKAKPLGLKIMVFRLKEYHRHVSFVSEVLVYFSF